LKNSLDEIYIYKPNILHNINENFLFIKTIRALKKLKDPFIVF